MQMVNLLCDKQTCADSKELEFTAALHTYIAVSDITKAKVDGLQGLNLLDKVSTPARAF